jgi:hypothetical protein
MNVSEDDEQPIIMQATKLCTGCGEVKPLASGFSRNVNNLRDGYKSKCKTCFKEYNQSNYCAQMVSSSKQADRKAGRNFDNDDYIDSECCANMLIEQNGDCCYCQCHMVYGPGINRRIHPDALTVERIENPLAHLKTNCLLACMMCNRTRGNNISHADMLINGRDMKRGIKKRCSGNCKRIISVASFSRNRSRGDGLDNKCKVCDSLVKRRRRQRRREMF